MAVVTTFAAFFGASSGGVTDADDAVEYAKRMQLASYGRAITHVSHGLIQATFDAIVYKERRVRRETDSGFDELVLRDVSFPADDTTGRAVVQLHEQIRIRGIKYVIDEYTLKEDFWHVTCRRTTAGAVTSPNRLKSR